ncbi:protein of unknown function [Muriicola jejuensis]|uniref:DUF4249 family protein n=1 Tax=Muriicola jejuensis TaxID=504488 RepID=A0A6P0UG17_9FLAO|nr:DUF4249 family protein [Muriicola jejuensis]NER09056.1 DUF4249 family protein [Muriicola jejuensis]SMP11526.1 protein of unknown function [Muriicola jejuensis]
MKRVVLLAVLSSILFSGCEDVIEVDLPEQDTRLVVDGLIRVDTDQTYLPVEIKLTLSSNFFEENVPTSAESVLIMYEETVDGIVVSQGSSSLAETSPGSGIYVPDPNFSSDQRIPTSLLDRNFLFTLLIRHQGRLYLAQTRYVPVVPINSITQGTGTLFGDNETEVIVNFTDQPEVDNFYIFDFGFGEYLVTEDEFYKGQEFEFSFFYDQEFDPGTVLDISIMGADQTFSNYMDQLIEQSGDSQGPFQTPVSTVRGNVFDVTDLDNIDVIDNVDQPEVFPLGYFAIVQEEKAQVTLN